MGWKIPVLRSNNDLFQARKMQFRKLAMCPGQRHLPLLFDNVVFTRDERGAATAINLKLYVRRQVDELRVSLFSSD